MCKNTRIKEKKRMNLLSPEQDALLSLVKQALWSDKPVLCSAEWAKVEALAKEQGVSWMLHLGAKAYEDRIPAEYLKAWQSITILTAIRNERVNAAQDKLVGWLAEKNIRAAVLKGTSCSRYYPYPEVRRLGDIDILIDKDSMKVVGDHLTENGFEVADHDHPFHVGYYSSNALVELHYEVTNVPESTGGKIVCKAMEGFLDDLQAVTVKEHSFPMLSDENQALTLLLHMERHMLEGGIGLRQLCDWSVFVNGTCAETWNDRILPLLERCGLLIYAKIVTKTCVDYLGLPKAKAPWSDDADGQLAAAMIDDVFHNGNMGAADIKSAGSWFTDRRTLGQGEKGKLKVFLSKLSALAYQHWPKVKYCKILLPFCWVYIFLRYFVRSICGLRPKKNWIRVAESSNRRQKLYNSMHLYEVKE